MRRDAHGPAGPSGGTFTFPVRVYYEDTDAAGVVYYANYLRFFERARTECLAAIGHPLAELERRHGIVFVVRRIEVDFLAPARLFDALEVTFEPERVGRAGLAARQEVRRGALPLARARVELACLDAARWKPSRIPADLALALPQQPSP
jgi:acyl-CoA thioester hydrolase